MFTELPLKLKYFNSCRFWSIVKAGGGNQDPTITMLTTIFFVIEKFMIMLTDIITSCYIQTSAEGEELLKKVKVCLLFFLFVFCPQFFVC